MRDALCIQIMGLGNVPSNVEKRVAGQKPPDIIQMRHLQQGLCVFIEFSLIRLDDDIIPFH